MRQCYLETVIHRPVPDATAGLVDLLTPSVPDMEVRHQIARAIGMGGITRNMIQPIFDKLKDVSAQGRRGARAHPRRRRRHGGARHRHVQRRRRAGRGDRGAEGRLQQDLRLLERPELRDRRHRALGRERRGHRAREGARPAAGLAAHHPRAQPGRVGRDRQRAALDDARAAPRAPDARTRRARTR